MKIREWRTLFRGISEAFANPSPNNRVHSSQASQEPFAVSDVTGVLGTEWRKHEDEYDIVYFSEVVLKLRDGRVARVTGFHWFGDQVGVTLGDNTSDFGPDVPIGTFDRPEYSHY